MHRRSAKGNVMKIRKTNKGLLEKPNFTWKYFYHLCITQTVIWPREQKCGPIMKWDEIEDQILKACKFNAKTFSLKVLNHVLLHLCKWDVCISDKSIGATQHCPLCKDNFVPRVSYLVLHCISSQMGPTYHFLRNFSLSCLINYWFKRTISFTSEFSLQTIYRVISSDCCNYTFSKYIQPKKLTKKSQSQKSSGLYTNPSAFHSEKCVVLNLKTCKDWDPSCAFRSKGYTNYLPYVTASKERTLI